jgi:hypothetical protein
MATGRHHSGAQSAHGGDRLAVLALLLHRQRTRARRQRRRWQTLKEGGAEYANGMQRWSEAIDGALGTAEQISREPANDIHDLVIKFEATWWWIVEDDSMLDATAKRWLTTFRGALRLLAQKG